MNARTTTLLTVLALALAACVAPIQAPPIKAPQPQTEQVLIPQTEPAQNKLPVTQPSLDPWAYPDYSMKAFDLYNQHQREKAAYALLNDLLTSPQTSVAATKEQAAYALLRDLLADQPQKPIYETVFR